MINPNFVKDNYRSDLGKKNHFMSLDNHLFFTVLISYVLEIFFKIYYVCFNNDNEHLY